MGKEIQHLEERKSLFYEILCVGFKEAVKSSLGIFKIMLPVSLLMAILNCRLVKRVFSADYESFRT